MAINLKQADGSRVTPTDDARLYQFLASDAEGLVRGCEISHKGGLVLHINSGWGVAQGRCFEITDQDYKVAPSGGGTWNGRFFVRIRPSQTPPVTLEMSSSSGSLSAPTKQEINYGGQIYEMELARFRYDNSVISDLEVTAPRLSAPGGGVYSATFRYNGWSRSGSTWTQTAACTGMQAGYNTSPPWIEKTGNQYTDAELQEALNALNEGRLTTAAGQIKATLYAQPPSCDVKIYMQRRELPT